MSDFSPAAYGPVFAELLAGDRCRRLDAGVPDESMRTALRQTAISEAFAHATIVNRDMAMCCLAGVWLVHDFLDESHTISQGVESSSGSFWHGIMHRREGDYANSKYWFRRVGAHDVLDALSADVAECTRDERFAAVARRVAPGGTFDPFNWVDACQAALRAGDESEQFCRRVQAAEWERLFDHCYRAAVGATPA